MSRRTAWASALATIALACAPARRSYAPGETPPSSVQTPAAPASGDLELGPYATAAGTWEGLTVAVTQIVVVASRDAMAASLHLADGAAATDLVIWSDAPTTTWRGYRIDVRGWSTASVTVRVSRGKTP